MPLYAESAVWLAVALATGAAALAVGVSAAAVLSLSRARRAPASDLGDVKATVSRTEAMVAELTGALEDARQESRRSRLLAEISSTIDLDAVLERALATAVGLPGVDAAMISLSDEEEALVATAGMSSEEAARQPVSHPSGDAARAVRIAYRYDDRHEEGPPARLIQGGIAVPLRDGDNEPTGTLAVFWRGSGRMASDDELAGLEELAASCGPAIRNAQRFREASKLADLDALTNLHNRRYFHETLAREVARAERYDRPLTLIVIDIDDFKAINDRIGHLEGDAVLATAAERLRSAVRGADVPCRIGGDEFGVILPEVGLGEAEPLSRRIQLAVGSGAIEPAERVHVSAGIAELRHGDDAIALFQRADAALYRAKEAGKSQVRVADGSSAPE